MRKERASWVRLTSALAACAAVLVGCAGTGRPGAPATLRHRGPTVRHAPSGPARFVRPLDKAFDEGRALRVLTYVDGFYRAPANDGYELVIDRLVADLGAAGFGTDPRLELRVLSEPMEGPAWTPLRASLALVSGGERSVLHAFAAPGDADRTMLPINAPSASVSGRAVLDLGELEEGDVLVTDAVLEQVMNRARQRGAAAVVSASLETFNRDPTGQKRHLDAVQFRRLRSVPPLPVAQISRASFERISAAVQRSPDTRLELSAEVRFDERELRTVVAAIVGRTRPDEAVAIASHVQEPGACDNASGVAGLLESAVGLSGLLKRGELEWPDRTLVFLWGDEFDQSRLWLDSTERRAVAGFSSDMTGESRTRTGAIALVERPPDPGALVTIAPDEHTPWGAGEVTEEQLNPNALAVVARCALNDVALHAGGWETADHPWEGGSDHDEFIARNIPAVLFWHFTDFAYHTSLDRLPMVDSAEMRRTQVALLAAALAVCDPRPADLARYHDSVAIEEEERVLSAESAGRADIARLWREWTKTSHEWIDRELGPATAP